MRRLAGNTAISIKLADGVKNQYLNVEVKRAVRRERERGVQSIHRNEIVANTTTVTELSHSQTFTSTSV